MAGVRTRFAPSPTGFLHIGNARTALFNWLFARKHGGRFILRIDDTDTNRSEGPYELALFEDLKWLGIAWDEGPDLGGDYAPYRQSERLRTYKAHAEKLVAEGKAYRCYCTNERLKELKAAQEAQNKPPRYDGRCRALKPGEAPEVASPVIRFRVPHHKEILFNDGVHGPISFDSCSIGDFIIMGSDGIASYNFAAVVDDALMEITHIIRGDDHLSNTPRQILLFDALGLKPPVFNHIPLVLGPDKSPLSKRHGTSSIRGLRNDGYLPEAVVNAMARLGWSPGEAFLIPFQMALAFSIEKLSNSPSEFDLERLKSFNKEAIQKKGTQALIRAASIDPDELDWDWLEEALALIKPNASTIKEMKNLLLPFIQEPALDGGAGAALSEVSAKAVIKAFRAEAEKYPVLDEGSYKAIIESVKALTGEKGKGLYLPIRLALTGADEGIELANVLRLLGKKRVLERLEKFEG